MVTEYIQAAMHKAHYELIEDGTFVGTIPGLQGVLANAETLEACRDELQSALEDWLVFRIERHLSIPVIDDIQLIPEQEVA